jgi:hypothetical protein
VLGLAALGHAVFDQRVDLGGLSNTASAPSWAQRQRTSLVAWLLRTIIFWSGRR